MKWVMINNKRNVLEEYRLTEDGDVKAVVKYNPLQRSVRITVGDIHRLFFIENTGSLSGKYIFKNEYGMEMGMMNNHVWGKEGTVEIASKKYIYIINNNPPAELSVHDAATKKLLLSCNLATSINGTSLSLTSQNNTAGSNYLLLGLCWFLGQSVAKQNIVEYAA